MTLVVHPHFHPRRTGVTRHVNNVVATLQPYVEARAIGDALDDATPRIGWRELWRRLRSERMIWHAHRNNELLWGLALRALGHDVKLVFTRHSGTRPGRFTQLLARRADRLITLNDVMASEVGLASDVVSHGVDLERFAPPQDRPAAWHALGRGGEYGIGVVGRVRPAKGQGDFVEAIAPLLPKHPTWSAVMVGRIQPTEALWARSLSEKAPAVAQVEEQSDVAPWMRALSILVQPSHSEGFSLVLMEALAAGCCVIASRLPYVPQVIDHGRTGFLYPPGDVQALRALLEALLADPGRVASVGQAAAKEAVRRFGIDTEARALVSLYTQLLG